MQRNIPVVYDPAQTTRHYLRPRSKYFLQGPKYAKNGKSLMNHNIRVKDAMDCNVVGVGSNEGNRQTGVKRKREACLVSYALRIQNTDP